MASRPLYDYVELREGGYEGIDINGNWIADDMEQAILVRRYIDEFKAQTECPYCGSPLFFARFMVALDDTITTSVTQSESFINQDYDHISLSAASVVESSFLHKDIDDRALRHDSAVWSCHNCAYWQIHWYIYEPLSWGPQWGCQLLLSKIKEFDPKLAEGCDVEIAQALRRHPEYFHSISPYRFERFIASVIKSNYSECEVIHLGGPNDGGVDVFYVDSHGREWLVQVKRRESHKASEGVEVLRNLLGAMYVEGVPRGIVVSTADHFTYRAYHLAKRAQEKGMTMSLVDRGVLNRMLGSLLPDREWIAVVKDYLSHCDVSIQRAAQYYYCLVIPSPRQLGFCGDIANGTAC